MKISQTFHTSINDIKNKKYNILIPICVGNKFFLNNTLPTQNIKKYIKRALQYSREKILIIIADKIQISNRIVRNSNISYEQNMRRLMRRGVIIKKNISKVIETLPKKVQTKIQIIRREEYFEKDVLAQETQNIIYREFKENTNFRRNVIEAVKLSVTDRKFNENEYLTLSKYVLDEFSLVYHGTIFDKNFYGLYIYPQRDKVLELIENIKERKTLPQITDKLNKQKIAVALIQ